MIRLTKLNKTPFVINCELIKFIENAPDTVITLTTGDKVVVRESMEEVIDKVAEFRRSLMATARQLPETCVACAGNSSSSMAGPQHG